VWELDYFEKLTAFFEKKTGFDLWTRWFPTRSELCGLHLTCKVIRVWRIPNWKSLKRITISTNGATKKEFPPKYPRFIYLSAATLKMGIGIER